ncbi:MAG TPA: tetratricopeptide repeat protein [Patescibacteria group bacterium]|nr:tetratricopeptide repeat protein [Patescibacteria group bacterium]
MLAPEDRIPVLVIGICVALALGAALANGFAWDDRPLIVENRLIRDPGSLGTLVASGFWQTGDRHDRFRSFFRPVVSLSYALDYAVWGLRPFGFHLTNLLVHFLCSLLVYVLARDATGHRLAATMAAALFAAHPAHVESVAWISGRTDLLCALFLLGAFLVERRRAEPEDARRWTRWVAMGLFALALLSKEMAATFPILVALDRLTRDGTWRARLRQAAVAGAPYVAVFVLYLGARHAVLGQEGAPLFSLAPIAWCATATFVLARYATLMILPIGLDPHYPYAALAGFSDPVVPFSLALILCAGAGAVAVARRSRGAAFALLWTGLTILPVLRFGSFGDVLLADRFLYIPSVGLALLLAQGLASVDASQVSAAARRVLAGAGAVALAALVVQSERQTRIWKNDRTLFTRLAESSPQSAMVRCNLGLALYDAGEYGPAKDEFRDAIALVPGYALAHNNLAAALEREGRLDEALYHYRQALALAPLQIETRVNVGSLLVRLDNRREGMAMLEDVTRSHPKYAPAQYALADAADRAGDEVTAAAHAERAIELDPFYGNPWYLLGKIRLAQGQEAEAAEAMRRFLALWPLDDEHRKAAERVASSAAPARPPSAPAGADPRHPAAPDPTPASMTPPPR